MSELLNHPPQWPLRVLRSLIKREHLEEIEGDMEERFYDNLDVFGLAKSRRLYVLDTFKLMRPKLLRNLSGDQKLNQYGMYQNYAKVTFRSIWKHKVYATIKIGGFAIGIAISILIGLFVRDELSIDAHLKNKEVYRVLYDSYLPSMTYKSTSLPPILSTSLEQDYPEVQRAGRVLPFDGFGDAGGNLFRPEEDDRSVYEERFAYADVEIPDMLGFEMTYGSIDALREPMTLILSEKKAAKYFPGEDPVGKLVFINENEKEAYQITGVFKALEGSHLNEFDFFFTLSGKEFWPGEQTSWCCNNYSPYLEFANKEATLSFQGKLKDAFDRYFVTYAKEQGEPEAPDMEKYNTLALQKASDIYLHSADYHDFLVVGDIATVRIFGAVALFIVLLACVNFVNLSTANSGNRAREIGLRKAVGSTKSDIVRQFLTEAVLLTTIAVLIGTVLAQLAIPAFNQVTGKTLSLPFATPAFYAILLAFAVLTGLVSGLYPSFYLGSFEPIKVLGGKLQKGGKGNLWLRNILVIFQFTVSMILITGAIMVYRQMDFVLSKDVGFEKDQVVMIHGINSMGERMETFKDALLELPEVQSATISGSLPVVGTDRNGNGFWKAGRVNIDKSVGGQFWRTDDDYFETLSIAFQEGRAFDLDLASDSNAAVINRAMARELGLENPLKEKVENFIPWKIVGVVEDFHYEHLTEEIRPLLIAPGRYGDIISVKVQPGEVNQSLAKITSVWDEFLPNQTFRYDFLDARYQMMYEGMERTKTVFFAFAAFGVIVACLGLFGLSVFAVAQRSKEMTIRKVLGASIQSIMGLLTIDFVKLVLVGLVLAVPIAAYAMQRWLENFEYSITRIWDIFLLSGVLLVGICLLVIGKQALQAARSNPAEGLRNE